MTNPCNCTPILLNNTRAQTKKSEMADKASLFVRKGDQVLLVEQQGPDDSYPIWSVPGGGVEIGETPQEGAIRETWEETGLRVAEVGPLAYITSMITRGRTSRCGIALAFDAIAYEDADIHKPQLLNDYILRAAFLPLPEALERLNHSPYRYIVQPMMAHLTGEARLGTLWQVIFGANVSDADITQH